MSFSTLTAFSGAHIFTGEAFVDDCALLVQNGKVLDIVSNGKIPPNAENLAFNGKVISPGFIDCQVNGGGGALLNETPTADTVLTIAKAHRACGTTRILPTCISDSIEVMQAALTATRNARKSDASILGIHFEGPHISREKRGCHVVEKLRPPSNSETSLLSPEKDEVMIVTVAPECVTADYIQSITSRRVIISLGHSAATAEQTRTAISAGANGFTHLFNAMTGMSARAPGIAGCALDDKTCWCGIIADGHHVSAEMIRLAHKAKPPGKLFLVSDAMPPSGSGGTSSFKFYGEEIKVKDGRCINRDGQLSGSAITLSDAVVYCISKAGIEPAEALKMASTYPAAFLGLDSKLGKLLPGYEADIAVLNHDYKPETSFVGDWIKNF